MNFRLFFEGYFFSVLPIFSDSGLLFMELRWVEMPYLLHSSPCLGGERVLFSTGSPAHLPQ